MVVVVGIVGDGVVEATVVVGWAVLVALGVAVVVPPLAAEVPVGTFVDGDVVVVAGTTVVGDVVSVGGVDVGAVTLLPPSPSVWDVNVCQVLVGMPASVLSDSEVVVALVSDDDGSVLVTVSAEVSPSTVLHCVSSFRLVMLISDEPLVSDVGASLLALLSSGAVSLETAVTSPPVLLVTSSVRPSFVRITVIDGKSSPEAETLRRCCDSLTVKVLGIMIDAEGWRRRETVRFWSSLVSVCVVVRCDWGSVAVRSAGEEAVGVCCCFCCCCCVALCVAVPLSAVGSIEGERSDETLSEGVGDTVVNWSLLMETEAVPTTVPTVAVCVGVGSSEVVRPLLVFGGDNVTSALGETEAEAAANNVADRSAVPVLVARAEAEAVFSRWRKAMLCPQILSGLSCGSWSALRGQSPWTKFALGLPQTRWL